VINTGFYRHYKGNFYYVIAIVKHSEERQALPQRTTICTPADTTHQRDTANLDEARDYVLYQALYGDYGLWVRPASMFAEQLPSPDDARVQIPRFAFLPALPEQHPVDLTRLVALGSLHLVDKIG
jgi:hypothetical protein